MLIPGEIATSMYLLVPRYRRYYAAVCRVRYRTLQPRHAFSDISFGMCLSLMSWVQQVHNAAVVARSLGCQCDTEIPTGRTLNAAASIRVINQGRPMLRPCPLILVSSHRLLEGIIKLGTGPAARERLSITSRHRRRRRPWARRRTPTSSRSRACRGPRRACR